MALIPAQDITMISLVLASCAVAIAVVGLLFRPKTIVEKPIPEEALDAIALVKEFSERQRRLEQRMVDEKVRLEILELRVSRQVAPSASHQTPSEDNKFGKIDTSVGLNAAHRPNVGNVVESRELSRLRTLEPPEKNVALSMNEDRSFPTDANTPTESDVGRRDSTIIEILQAVSDGHGSVTARQIQERIHRSREHTARMMNELHKEGLVLRNIEARPFTYSLTDAGRSALVR